MKKLLACLLTLCLSTPAFAANKVLFYGDSRTSTGGTSSYPTLVANSKNPAVFSYCVNSVNGRNSQEGKDQLASALAACPGATDIVILMGVADMLEIAGTTPLYTAMRLMDIATAAQAAGVRPWIVTEPPTPILWGGVLASNAYTRDVANFLYMFSEADPVIDIIDMRDKFTEVYWYASTCSNDGLHPTGLPCRQAMADAVKVWFP